MKLGIWGGLVGLGLMLCSAPDTLAQGLTFGIVGKTKNDINFERAWQGCLHAAEKDGNQCVFIGALGSANPRTQVLAIKQALASQHFDALAISVTKSDYVAEALSDIQVPIITFDSPFEEQDRGLSRGYVGIDNQEVGEHLAEIAKRLYPQGAHICLMTAANEANLDLRMIGIRSALSQDDSFAIDHKLNGEHGWYECSRSPWNTADSIARTMDELSFTLSEIKPDALLSTGHWPIANISQFYRTIAPFRDDITSGKTKLLVVVGEVEGIDELLEQKLIHGYVKINFADIGALSYKMMLAVAQNRAIPSISYMHELTTRYLEPE